jgi:hypothetical protein
MSTEKKSLVEEALLQMKNLQNVVSENAKGILSSTMKEEIEELVKESLEEETEDEMEMGSESYTEEGPEGMEGEEEDSMTIDMSNTDMGDDSEEITMSDVDMTDDEIEPLDMTNASDDELLKIVLGMGDEDRLIVQKSGDNIQADMLTKTDSMSFPAQGELEMGDESEIDYENEMGDESEESEEIVYEIEMDDDELEEGQKEDMMESKGKTYLGVGMGKGPKKDVFKKGENMGKGFNDDKKFAPEAKKFVKGEFKESAIEEIEEESNEGEMEEAARTLGNGKRNFPKRHGLPKMKVVTNSALEEEVRVLRLKNEEYRKALNIFREKLNEVAVFNSNLAYATRLFTEHTTTKQEKINIMRRFDNVETIKESKNLYSLIKDELGSKSNNVVKESIVENIDRTPSNGSTNLIESKTYENPQFLRMKDLMSKLNK